MTVNSFDTIFSEFASDDDLLYKGQARTAMKYAHFDLDNIDNPDLAKKIITKALVHAKESETKTKKKAFSFPNVFKTVDKTGNPPCPRCGNTTSMQNAELLGNVKAFYCPICRLTEIA